MRKKVKSDLLVIAEEEKAKRAAELVIANEEKAKRAAELVIANEEKAKRAAELITANKEKAKRAAELVIANKEKAKREEELAIARAEKAKLAVELIIANTGKAKRAAESVIANAEKAKLAAVLLIANIEKEKLEVKLIDADKELTNQYEQKIKLAAELLIADINKTKIEAELAVAKIDKAKRSAELVIANKELVYQKDKNTKRASESAIADAEKSKRKSDLVITNINGANRAAELVVANTEKAKRSAELVIASKEPAYKKREKPKREAELLIAKVEKARLVAKRIIANIEKAKRAAEFVATSKELVLAKEKENLLAELTAINKELSIQINERKLTEKALQNSYALSETILRTIPFGMHIVDETGTVLFQNDNSEKNLGESAIGKKCWELYRDNKKQCSDCPLIKGIIIGKAGINESQEVPGNKLYDIIHTGIMFYGKKAMLEIFIDITEKKQKEAEMMRAKEKAEESDRLKSSFLTNMSHEIRTPMNGILGFADLLKEPNLSDEDQQDFIHTIQISGARMLNTINNIIDMSKIESGLMNLEIIESNINDNNNYIYKFFKPEIETKGLQFFIRNGLSTNDAIIRTDNEKVYAILMNLVKNAIKFTYEGSIELGYEKKGAYLEFFVKDTGSGIPAKQKELIFERFRQGSESSYNRDYEGSGLGLSIAKSYLEMLGGEIWVDSLEGKGSTFYFTIPYNPVSGILRDIQNTVTHEVDEIQSKNLKILIVEDDEISYSLLTITLQKISYEVLHAVNGVQAIEACRINPDIDLVLMDIRMPDMDGYEATVQIRQFNNNVIIIAQTAYAFAGDREKAIEAGCNDYISKPINASLLLKLIKKYVNK